MRNLRSQVVTACLAALSAPLPGMDGLEPAVRIEATGAGFRFHPAVRPRIVSGLRAPRPARSRVVLGAVTYVNGHAIRPGVDLRGATNLAGADLSGLDLRHARLDGLDLTDANLEGADLSHACLRKAILTRARFRGARLFKADLLGALGGHLGEARFHPFFCLEDPQPVGAVRLFVDEEVTGGQEIRSLVAGPTGNLYWLKGERGELAILARSGAAYSSAGAHRDPTGLALAVDAEADLQLLGRKLLQSLNLNAFERGTSLAPVPVLGAPNTFLREAPRALLPLGGIGLLAAGPWGLLEIGPRSGGVSSRRWTPFPQFDPQLCATVPGTRDLSFFDTTGHRLVKLEEDCRTYHRPLDTGATPTCLTVTPDGATWYALGSHLSRQDWHGGESVTHPLPKDCVLTSLVQGPDGNLWGTATGADRFLRITPTGTVTPFRVPRGTRPVGLQPYLNGRLLFRTEGSARFGTLQVVAHPGSRKPGIPFAPAEPKRTGAETTRALAASQAAAEQRLAWLDKTEEDTAEEMAELAFEDAESPSHPEEKGTDVPEPEPEPGHGPGPALARQPVLRLFERGVNLTPSRTRAILRKHGAGRSTTKGKFNLESSRFRALQELLAQGLEATEATAFPGQVEASDAEGRRLTFCTLPHTVGTARRLRVEGGRRVFGPRTPTNRFAVVTQRHLDPETGQATHDVITAYPVMPEAGGQAE